MGWRQTERTIQRQVGVQRIRKWEERGQSAVSQEQMERMLAFEAKGTEYKGKVERLAVEKSWRALRCRPAAKREP